MPILPPLEPSLFPNRFHGGERGVCLGSFREDTEVDELLLRDAGEAGADESGVEDWKATALRAAVAAAAGLQWAQVKMLKPRPLQLGQMAPLQSSVNALGSKGTRSARIPWGVAGTAPACQDGSTTDARGMRRVKIDRRYSVMGHSSR